MISLLISFLDLSTSLPIFPRVSYVENSIEALFLIFLSKNYVLYEGRALCRALWRKLTSVIVHQWFITIPSMCPLPQKPVFSYSWQHTPNESEVLQI